MAVFQEKFSFCATRLNEGGRSGAGQSGGSCESLSEALGKAFSAACFYMGAEGCRVQVEARCAACGGVGVVGGTARRKGGTCKACKGKPIRELADFVAEPPKECEIWRYGERVSAPQSELDRSEIREARQRGRLEDRLLRLLGSGVFSAKGCAEQLSVPEVVLLPFLGRLESLGEIVANVTTDRLGTHRWYRRVGLGLSPEDRHARECESQPAAMPEAIQGVVRG